MRGARGQSVVLSVAIIASSLGLCAQQAKSFPAHKNSSAAATVTAQSGDLNRDTTFSLLREAYNTSRDLASEQRIPLLTEICEISASMNFKNPRIQMGVRGGRVGRHDRVKASIADLTKKQSERLRDWSEELFRLGSEFPPESRLRSQAEIEAVRSMVSIDPKRAMEQLDSIESMPASHGWDPRWSAVSALFNQLYSTEGAAALPDIRREALSLGDGGAYPYFAISNLLNQVQKHPEVTRQFFSDAVEYFRRGEPNRSQVFGFMSLLGSEQIRNQLEAWQVQDATTQMVAQVKAYARKQTEVRADGDPGDPGVHGLLESVRGGLKRFAPEMAAEIPDPASLPSDNGYLLSVNMRHKAPQAAAPDDSMKSLEKAFETSRTAMMKLGEDEVHEGPEVQQTIDNTIALGAEWVERRVQSYAPGDHAFAILVSTPELASVARIGAHINPVATLGAIREIQDNELKTKLLLSVARTIEYMR